MVKKFFLIAGESSGDLLGSKLIKEIKSRHLGQECQFVGVGGDLMQKEGFASIFNMSELSVMGFVEVLPHIPKLLRRINQVASEVKKQKPDYVITIDSPDFSFRVMKKLRKYHDSKKVHLIAPSVWAYRAGRAKKIAKLYDLLLAILPFEPPYFTNHGLKTEFIGSPIVENIPDFASKDQIKSEFRQKYNFDNSDKLLYVTPGSRGFEVAKIFPELIAAINEVNNDVKNLRIVIAAVDKVRDQVVQMSQDIEAENIVIEPSQRQQAMMSCNYALAKSGTNTVELSLYKIPLIVCYKFNALTYFILDKIVTNRFANLINIIMNRYVIKEHIQNDCTGKKIANSLRELMSDEAVAKQQLLDCEKALKIMGMGSKKTSTAKAVDEILKI